MRPFCTLIVLSLLFAMPAFAIEGGPVPKGSGDNFEQKKEELLKKIDERMRRLQERKSCVQAATTLDALSACREKFKRDKKGTDGR
jgi:hypothetical protein